MKDTSSAPLRSRTLLLVPMFLLIAALTLNIVSLAMPLWVRYQVDQDRAASDATKETMEYYSRTRGVFLTCLLETRNPMLTKYRGQVKYDSCLEMDFGDNLHSSNVGFLGWGARIILIMRRVHLALHLLAGFFLCLGLITCVISCSCFGGKRASIGMFVAAGFGVMAAGFQFGAQVVFMNYMLQETLPPGDGTAAASPANIYNAWPTAIQQVTRVSLDASYYIALASFGASLASGNLCMICGASLAFKLQKAAPASVHSGYPADPVDSTAKNSGDTAQMETFSNLSVTRLPRVSVHTNQGYTPY